MFDHNQPGKSNASKDHSQWLIRSSNGPGSDCCLVLPICVSCGLAMVRVYITGCSDVTLRWLRRLFSGELISVQLSICLFTVVFLACVASSGVTTSEAPRGKLFLGAPTFLWAPKECQNYNYLSLSPPPGNSSHRDDRSQ